MVNGEQTVSSPTIRCRQIADADLPGIADLLKRGFGSRRTLGFWRRALTCLQARSAPADMPRYGYVLESGRNPVGVILLIFAATPGNGAMRANVSSWYVDPRFRGYAPLLVSQALKLKSVTYMNISAVRHTWPILQAQGYRRYSNGIFVAFAALRGSGDDRARLLAAATRPDAPFEPFERDLLLEHAAYGCVSFWCETPERAFPFVFRPRRVKGVIPCAQLVYCRDVADVARFAGRIGRLLALRGRPFVVIDANGPIAGLPGKYFDETMPKYYRGPARPRLGDLAYTEAALFGI
jgi:plasmid stabilization system protein ParE